MPECVYLFFKFLQLLLNVFDVVLLVLGSLQIIMKFVFTEISGAGSPPCLKDAIFEFADGRTQFRLLFLDIFF